MKRMYKKSGYKCTHFFLVSYKGLSTRSCVDHWMYNSQVLVLQIYTALSLSKLPSTNLSYYVSGYIVLGPFRAIMHIVINPGKGGVSLNNWYGT